MIGSLTHRSRASALDPRDRGEGTSRSYPAKPSHGPVSAERQAGSGSTAGGRRATAGWLGIDAGRLARCELPVSERYPETIAAHIALADVERKKIERKLGDKVELAGRVLATATPEDWRASVPSYIGPLYQLIRRSRAAG